MILTNESDDFMYIQCVRMEHDALRAEMNAHLKVSVKNILTIKNVYSGSNASVRRRKKCQEELFMHTY